MARKPVLPFQILMTLRVAALVLALTVAFLWFVLGRAQQQIEQSGRETFSLLAYGAFAELDAITQLHMNFISTLSRTLPLMPDYYGDATARVLAQNFVQLPGPNAMTVVRPNDDMLYVLKYDPEAPAGTAYTIGRYRMQASGKKQIEISYHAADHTLLSQRFSDFQLRPSKKAWHIGAWNADGLYYSYPHPIPNRSSLALSLELRSGNTLLGLVTPLELIDSLLKKLSVSANGMALMLDDDQNVVGMRTNGERWHDLNINNLRMKSVAQIGNPVLKDAASATSKLAENQTSLVTLSGQPYLLAWHAMANVSGTHYRMLLLAPLSDMSKVAERARHDAWIVAIVGLLILLPLTWFGTGAMARVMQRLVQDSERISHLDFGPAEQPIRSRVSEVQALGLAHDMMRSALSKGTRALERVSRQLARLIGIGVDLVEKKDRQDLLDAVLDAAREMAGAEAAVLFLRDENEMLRPAATLGLDSPQRLLALDMKVPELKSESLAVHTALTGTMYIVDDLDDDPRKELVNLRKWFPEFSNSHPVTIVSLPMRTTDHVIGVMQVFNARDPDSGQVAPFSASQITYLEALAAQATVALENQKLIASQSQLLDSLVRTLGDAVDAKSAYTGRHCARVPELAVMLAQEAHAASSGPLASFGFNSEDEWREFRTGAWLHDCGKITSPEHVMDKATKLETVYNRVHEIRTRFEVFLRDAHIEILQAQLSGRMDAATATQVYEQRRQVLQDDYAFIAACNLGSEKMADADIARVQAIGKQTWLRHFDDQLGLSYEEKRRHQAIASDSLPVATPLIANQPWHLIQRQPDVTRMLTEGFHMQVPELLYNHGELYNLCVERGTLTREERFKINEHIIHTIRMLESAHFPAQLRRVPEYAGTHHETLDGSGYPRGLTAAELSIPARIMAIADIFEALTASDRPYKPAKPLSESIAILHRMKLKGLIDPDLFDLFLRSGVHLRYAQRFLEPEQIDLTDITPYLG